MLKNITNLAQNRLLSLGVIILIVTLAYSNTFKNEFVIEDSVYLLNWPLTQDLANLPKMFIGDTSPFGNVGVYRPFRTLFYSFSYNLWKENPTPYHIQALVVHLLVVVLIYFIAEIILKKKILAILVALLFSLHPVHTEPIDYLTANFDTIGEIFFFASFLFYLRATVKLTVQKLDYLISILLAIVAFFSFEMNFTLPFLILAYDFIFRRKVVLSKFSSVIRIYAPYFAIALIYLIIRIPIFNITSRAEGYLGGSFYLTMLTMVKAIIYYIELLILPANLSINPTIAEGINSWVHPLSRMDKILSQSLFSRDILIDLAVILALLFAAFKFAKKLPIISFSIIWFFISILPVMYFIPQGPIAQERYVYIASFGYVLFLVYLVGLFYQRKYNPNIKRAVRVILIILLLFTVAGYFYLTYQRNKDWKDSFAVWSKLVLQLPNDILANFDTANLYQKQGQDELAVNYYNRALAIEYKLYEAHFALGQIYLKHGFIDQAINSFNNTLAINPNLKAAKNVLNNLSSVQVSTNSALFNTNFNFVDYKTNNGLTFSFSPYWGVEETKDKIVLTEADGKLKIEIALDQKSANTSNADYLVNQRQDFGELVSQGLAQIPSVDFAYVRRWNDHGIEKLQFFLFKDGKVVKILVYPADSELMKELDQFLSSLKI